MQNLIEMFSKLSTLPMARQLSLLVGLAISIAVGVGIVLWSSGEDYGVLYSELNDQEAAQIVDSLERLGVDYRLDGQTGLISVPESRKHELRLKLAGEGLPSKRGGGFDILYDEHQFGTTSFMETARFNRALEEELAASIATLDSVRSARVHLAIPKRSSFIRSQSKANASVLIELKPGRVLDDDQSAGIVYMVASSVPALEPEGVTLLDQQGRMLSNRNRPKEMAIGTEQFRFARAIEADLEESVMDILIPIVGENKVRARVVADLNFTTLEKTIEEYDPRSLAIRSEHTVNETNASVVAMGAPDLPDQTLDGLSPEPAEPSSDRMVKATRNYEIDYSISHIKESPGSINRLSVAVVIDYRSQVLEDGTIERTPLSEAELTDITTLVREAVGFKQDRGDTVSVTNAPFQEVSTEYEELMETPLWQEAWVQGMVKQALGFLGVLVLILAVVRPMLRSMVSIAERPGAAPAIGAAGAAQGTFSEQGPGAGNVSRMGESPEAIEMSDYGRQLAGVRNLVEEDPTRVAQVIRGWVAADG